MDISLLVENLTNPALMFFFLGILAVQVRSDLEIPASSSRFISLYLLFSIGFKGGQELSHSSFDMEIGASLIFGILLALLIPVYAFFLLRGRVGVDNAGAIAAAYGSVSAVTFVTTVAFLEMHEVDFGGHMVAVMSLMEAPAIIVGVALLSLYGDKRPESRMPMREVLRHALTNGSVLLITGSLLIGLLASEAQAEGIKPFTTDIFKGFLAVFLLDMGISSGRRLSAFLKEGWLPAGFALLAPLVNGVVVAWLSGYVTDSEGNRLLFAVLGASASYIAVPAAMKLAAPGANAGLYVPMALGVTFPFNITLGIPLYYYLIQLTPI